MQPNHIILQTTPALHSWLGKKLSDKNVSQRQLAALLGRDNASVNRWLADKESIPPGLFLQAVSVAFPEESRAAEYLLHVHDRAKLLPGAAAKIVSSGGMEAALETARIIARRAEEAAAHFDDGNSALRYQFLSDYVGAGYSTLNMIRACHEENEPFINPTNVKIHLKFPHNVMTADLIQSARKHPQRLEEMSKN